MKGIGKDQIKFIQARNETTLEGVNIICRVKRKINDVRVGHGHYKILSMYFVD